MRTPILFLILTLGLFASPDLDHVRQARELLGSDTWSRVLRIDNRQRHAVYPKITYALVFEFNRILWLYTPYDGTQSLSLHRGRLDREKSDLAPLLAAIAPGFTGHEVVDGPADVSSADAMSLAAGKKLPNGCFVESIAALRQRLGREWVKQAALLCYYFGPNGSVGHTVLTYQDEDGLWVWDPDRPTRSTLLGRHLVSDPRRLAELVHSQGTVAHARLLQVEVPLLAASLASAVKAGEAS